MSIVETFGRRGITKKEPNLIEKPSSNLPAQSRPYHPDALKLASDYSYAMDEIARLQAELNQVRSEMNETVRQLRSDLELERRSNTELQRLVDEERKRADYYHGYATEIRVHLGTLAESAIKANDIALKIAQNGHQRPALTPSPAEEKSMEAVDAALSAARQSEEEPG